MTRARLNATVFVVLASLTHVAPAAAQSVEAPPRTRSGQDVYAATCIACHGPDGRGTANAELTKIIALPDFSDCRFAAREADADWLAVAHGGGPARGFSPLMRAWSGEFTEDELRLVINHLRTFCRDERWPRGELNFPRPLVTEKAFPEDEMVVSASASTGNSDQVVTKVIYERRIGPLNQFEVSVPVAASETLSGGWAGGLGDIAIGFKRALTHSLRRGHIVSVSGEVVLPTGSESRGLGSGVAVFEPFVTYGQLLSGNRFIQAQAGFEFPASGDHDGEAFWRVAVGQSLNQRTYGRTWSPIVELVAARPLTSSASIEWDLVPQMQVTLNARQHVRLSGGVRVPVTDRRDRSSSIVMYLLWDWFDGGLLDGW